jgi:tetratricopeptide (TPR) repeat protein
VAAASAWFAAPVVAAPDPAVRAVYEACVSAAWPTSDDAEDRNRACSKALQTRMLAPREIARARVTRGMARVALGNRVLATDDYVEALRHYESAIDSKNPDALDLAHQAASLDGLGQTERALEVYAQAIKRDPQSGLAYLGRGVLLASRKRAYERAIEDFDKVIALNDRNVEALIARGSALGELGHIGRALADLHRAVMLSPGRGQPYVERGKIYDRTGKPDAALKDFDTALQVNLRDASAFINRAAVHAKQGNHDAAIRDLDAALTLGEGTPVLFYNRGYSRFARGEYTQAIADYNVAIALDADSDEFGR